MSLDIPFFFLADKKICFFRINLNLNDSEERCNTILMVCCSYIFDDDTLHITNKTLDKIIFVELLYLYVHLCPDNKNDEISYISFLNYLRLNCNSTISIYFENGWFDIDDNLHFIKLDTLQCVYSKVESNDDNYCLMEQLFGKINNNLCFMKGEFIVPKNCRNV